MYILGDIIIGTNFTIDKNDKVTEIAQSDLSTIECIPKLWSIYLDILRTEKAQGISI